MATKKYRVKIEFVDNWTNDVLEELIVTEEEVNDLSIGWGIPVGELMEQLEEY